MENSEQQLARVLAPNQEEIRSFAQTLRTELKRMTKPAFELAGHSAQSFNIGYGFTTTLWDCYCAIIVYQKHLNISLPSGVALTDPESLLHGKGSRVRDLKIKKLKDLQSVVVRALLKEARKNALESVEGDGCGHDGVRTIL